MKLEWDEVKRNATLQHRGLDFADAAEVFTGLNLTVLDDRREYGELRYQTMGQLWNDVVMLVWTPRDGGRRIISMRKCDGPERARYLSALAGG